MAQQDRDDTTPSGPPPVREAVLGMRTSVLGDTPPVPDRRFMPADFAISVAASGALDARLVDPAPRPRRQPMRGYEETFTDIVDFIVRVTHHIWEEKAIGYLYEHYRHNVTVREDSGYVHGRDHVIAASSQLMSAFPDFRLFADEVIWCGDEDQGFWTSHRAVMVGHNTGYSRFGPPTGRRVAVLLMANCRSIENQIFDEHVIYNTGSLMRQLGMDLHAAARAEDDVAPPIPDDLAAGQVERLRGQGSPMPPAPPGSDRTVGDRVRRAMTEIWNWRLLNKVEDYYAPGLRLHGPTDRELYGIGAFKGYVLELLSMFPDAALTVDDLHWMGNDTEGYSVAVRWTLVGTHRGAGYHGAPTGRRVHLWGIDHLRVVENQVVEMWSVNNELEVMSQLHRAHPRRPA